MLSTNTVPQNDTNLLLRLRALDQLPYNFIPAIPKLTLLQTMNQHFHQLHLDTLDIFECGSLLFLINFLLDFVENDD